MKRRVGEVGYILSGLARELYETGGNRPVFMVKNIEENLKHYFIPDVSRIEAVFFLKPVSPTVWALRQYIFIVKMI